MKPRRNVRSFPKRSVRPPQGAPDGLDLLNTKDYRVRRVHIVAELDVYDEEGRLEVRNNTDPIVLTEAQYFPGLAEFFASRGLKKGVQHLLEGSARGANTKA